MEENVTNGRKKMLNDFEFVDFKKMTVKKKEVIDIIDSSDAEKVENCEEEQEEDAQRVEDLEKMHQVKPRENAPLRLLKTPSHDRSGGEGRVVKKTKGTPINNSKIRKLRKIFEPSPTRGCAELLTQLSKPIYKQINFNPLDQTTTTTSGELTRKVCVSQPERVLGTGPRQVCEMVPEPGQDWTTPPSLGTVSPIGRTVREDQKLRSKKETVVE